MVQMEDVGYVSDYSLEYCNILKIKIMLVNSQLSRFLYTVYIFPTACPPVINLVFLTFFFPIPPAPSASPDMTQKVKSSMQRSTASTSWASTCPSTWVIWWRRMRMLTKSSSLASSRMESPLSRQVQIVLLNGSAILCCVVCRRQQAINSGHVLIDLAWHSWIVWQLSSLCWLIEACLLWS